MKKSVALCLAMILLLGGLFACGKSSGGNAGTEPEGSTAAESDSSAGVTLPPLPTNAAGGVEVPTGEAAEVTTGESYLSPDKIPLETKGENYSVNSIPVGVAEIFAVGDKLLFSYVTRWEGDSETRKTTEYYTMFEYLPEEEGCIALSGEVGYIMQVGDSFLYDKTGTVPGTSGLWDVPYYVNSAEWNAEAEITGAMAQQLINAPKRAMIRGKEQAYTAQRVSNAITITLPESNDAVALTLDPKAAFGRSTPDGLMVDIRGVAYDKVYLSASCVPEDGVYMKELFSLGLDGSALTALRYEDYAIWADPTSEIIDGFLYGIANTKKGSALLKINTITNEVIHLATVKKGVWHFVATDDWVLYEIPSGSNSKGNTLGCAKIEK